MQQITTPDSIMNEAFLYFFAEIEYFLISATLLYKNNLKQ